MLQALDAQKFRDSDDSERPWRLIAIENHSQMSQNFTIVQAYYSTGVLGENT